MKTARTHRLFRAAAAALVIALVLSAALSAGAETVGYITGVSITEAGRLVWDNYPGAVDYWLGVDGGYTPVSNGQNIIDRFDSEGTHELELEAYTAGGETLIASWRGEVEYDGKNIKLTWSEEDPGIPTPEPTEAPTEAPAEEPTEAPVGTQTEAPAAETDAPSGQGETKPTEPVPEPDLPNQSIPSMLILGAYILLAIFAVGAVVAAIVIPIAVIRKKRK